MLSQRNNQVLTFQDNSEWLRAILLGGAVMLILLALRTYVAAEQETGIIFGSAVGALLLGVSGVALNVRRVIVDPLRRIITIVSSGFSRSVTEVVRFDEIQKLLLFSTYDMNEEVMPDNRPRENWSVALVLAHRSIPVRNNLYLTKSQAMDDTVRLQQLLNVQISDDVEEGITHLARNGRTIDAIVVATQTKGLTMVQAKDFVKKAADRAPN